MKETPSTNSLNHFKFLKMKLNNLISLFTFIAISTSSFGCKGQGINPNNKSDVIQAVSLGTKQLSAREAKILKDTKAEVVFLDVRTPEEIKAGTIDGSIKIDWSTSDFKEQISKLDKSKKYIVYCAVGGRSAKAQSVMKAEGFNQVYNMTGGYNEYKQIP
jgi:phage shock protein E